MELRIVKGSVVRKRNGQPFRNERMTAIVERIEPHHFFDKDDRIYFKETGTWLSRYQLVLAEPVLYDDIAVI